MVSSLDVSFNQALFDTLSFAAKAAGAPHMIDEIRFGTTFEGAVGIGGGSDYDGWSGNYPGADLGNQDADFDGDGLTNNEERTWGTNPASSASMSPYAVPLAANGTFSYTRRDPSLSELTYTVWTSTDLQVWTEDTGATQAPGTPDGNDVETVAVTLSPILLTESALFVRIQAAQ